MTNQSDFAKHQPWDSVLQNSESEVVARNIMIILARTGNQFRMLTWEEYFFERHHDGNFNYLEERYFDLVIDYFKSADTARLFSPVWKEIKSSLLNL